eukprot:TRINITY_DN29792_c0_g1_i1.p1 TRINITY_DN29792_c0_g1~~TRINITY_DN29792_c0_g1_i1.p1  ORF type:complete len:157 (-),score=41.08 TRINITY_DN29792_c0_g1_i1:3-428(-)
MESMRNHTAAVISDTMILLSKLTAYAIDLVKQTRIQIDLLGSKIPKLEGPISCCIDNQIILFGGQGQTGLTRDAHLITFPDLLSWTPNNHHTFPVTFQRAVRTILLMNVRDQNDDDISFPWNQLPVEIIERIIIEMAKNWY